MRRSRCLDLQRRDFHRAVHCVIDMPMGRAPRKLLTGWVAHPRSTGSPPMTFGRTLKKALVRCEQSPGFGVWSKVAADRVEWREVFGKRPLMPRPKPTAYAEQVAKSSTGPNHRPTSSLQPLRISHPPTPNSNPRPHRFKRRTTPKATMSRRRTRQSSVPNTN